MKKIILLSLLFLSYLNNYSQNGYEMPDTFYTKIKNKITFLDSISATELANTFVSSVDDKYKLIKVKKSSQFNVYRYYYSHDNSVDTNCDKCIKIDYSINNDYTFTLKQITGSSAALYKIWITNFLTTSNEQLILDSFKYREVKNVSKDVNIILKKDVDHWSIYNWF